MSKVTLGEIQKAKAEHQIVYVIEVDMNEQGKISDLLQDEPEAKIDTSGKLLEGENIFRALLKKPEKKVIGLALTSKDPIQMGNIFLKNCILVADDEIMDDDDVNIAASLQSIKFVSLGQGSLKKF